ncbi:unnamed protein product, partial [Rotaria magnacalcarata]
RVFGKLIVKTDPDEDMEGEEIIEKTEEVPLAQSTTKPKVSEFYNEILTICVFFNFNL